MSEQKYLFIGGKHDGKWFVADGKKSIVFAISEPDSNYREPTWAGDVTRAWFMTRQNYIPHRFRGNEKEYIVYALQGISPDNVFEALIGNYSLHYLCSKT